MFSIKMGVTVKDKITGFSGIVTGRCEYITGCNQILVQPKIGKDGAKRDGHWIDEQRLTELPGKAVKLDNGSTPGPDLAAPVR